MKIALEQPSIGTWNVNTLWQTGKLEILRMEMERYSHDILGILEMRWTGNMNGVKIIWSGEEKSHTKGVGVILSKRARSALLGYLPVSPHIIAARFMGALLNLTVIQIYAPTAASEKDKIEEFYAEGKT